MGYSPPMSTRPERLIYKQELTKRVGLSFPTIWKQMRDGKFPRSRAVGGKSAWLESEIDNWIAGLPVRRLKGDPLDHPHDAAIDGQSAGSHLDN